MNCVNCNKETKNARFCSRNCSTSFNNKGKPHGPKRKKFNKCPICGIITDGRRTYCSLDHKRMGLLKRLAGARGIFALNEEEIFTVESRYSRSAVRRFILEKNVKIAACSHNVWEDKVLTKDLHHKNNVQTDNRKENLEFLCPNCHSMTENYKFKNGNKRRTIAGLV